MARYKPNSPQDYLAILDFINRAKENNKEVELKLYHPKRTGQQNKYLYFCLQWFAHEYNCTVFEAKEVILKRIAAPHIFEREMTVAGESIKYYRSTADLDTVEMMSAIANFRAYSDMNQIPIPDASDQDSIRYCEREIEKTAAFGT
ncbi:MAG: hypothetical protein IJ588_13775 [Prevotella sp.]|nr:hypothetical protein [Prevotella sp.]